MEKPTENMKKLMNSANCKFCSRIQQIGGLLQNAASSKEKCPRVKKKPKEKQTKTQPKSAPLFLNWPTCQYQMGVKGRQNFAVGLSLRRRSSNIISRLIDVGNISPRHPCARMTTTSMISLTHTHIHTCILYINVHDFHKCDIRYMIYICQA